MANVKVIYTDGKETNFLTEYPEAVRLRLIAKSNASDHDIGDFVTSDKHENMYALITRDELSDKNIPEAIRLGFIQLLKYLVEEEKKPEVILMNYYDLGNYKAQAALICIVKELFLTYFSEAFENEITLIICDCKKEDAIIKL